MTKMLASVGSVAEADIVMRSGADIIDIKHPGLGALGAQDVDVIQAIVEHVNGDRVVSATVGDILPDDPLLPERMNAVAGTGVDIVKVGLFARQPTSAFLEHIKSAAQKNKLVVVMFAENDPLEGGLSQLLQTGVYGIMVDTCIKNGTSLRQHMTDDQLRLFVRTIQSHNRLAGLAGSLSAEDIRPLTEISADYLGFRGALCVSKQRTSQIDAEQVQHILQTVHNERDIGYGEKYLKKAI